MRGEAKGREYRARGGCNSPEIEVDDDGDRGKVELDSGSLEALGWGFWVQTREGIEGYK